MLRTIAALVTAIALMMTGFAAPAAAANQLTPGFLNVNIDLNNSPSLSDGWHEPSLEPFDQSPLSETVELFLRAVGQSAITTSGAMVGSVLVCYSVDAAAATVFPPAAILSAYCPMAPALVGGSTLAVKGLPKLAPAWPAAHGAFN